METYANALLALAQDKYKYFEAVVDQTTCQKIHQELDAFKLPKAPALYGKVRQEFNYKYFAPNHFRSYPATAQLITEYLNQYSSVEEAAGFCPSTPVIAVNRYPVGGLIEAHYDESKYRNVLACFTISGSGKFSIHSDRQTKIIEYSANAGSLVLLAGPRDVSEKSIRPLHSIEVEKERLSIVIRHEVING